MAPVLLPSCLGICTERLVRTTKIHYLQLLGAAKAQHVTKLAEGSHRVRLALLCRPMNNQSSVCTLQNEMQRRTSLDDPWTWSRTELK